MTQDYKTAFPNVELEAVIAMRHVLVHGYYQIRDEIVWNTIQTELQPLKKIEALMNEME